MARHKTTALQVSLLAPSRRAFVLGCTLAGSPQRVDYLDANPDLMALVADSPHDSPRAKPTAWSLPTLKVVQPAWHSVPFPLGPAPAALAPSGDHRHIKIKSPGGPFSPRCDPIRGRLELFAGVSDASSPRIQTFGLDAWPSCPRF